MLLLKLMICSQGQLGIEAAGLVGIIAPAYLNESFRQPLLRFHVPYYRMQTASPIDIVFGKDIF